MDNKYPGQRRIIPKNNFPNRVPGKESIFAVTEKMASNEEIELDLIESCTPQQFNAIDALRKEELFTVIKGFFANSFEERLQESGMNVDRVVDFLKDKGLTLDRERIIFYKKDELEDLDKAIMDANPDKPSMDFKNLKTSPGYMLYEPNTDLVLIDLDNIKSLGAVAEPDLLLKSFLVHEGVHRNTGVSRVAYRMKDSKSDPILLRMGFITQTIEGNLRGQYLEEGLVRYYQAQYVGKFRTKENRELVETRIQNLPKDSIYKGLEPNYLYLKVIPEGQEGLPGFVGNAPQFQFSGMMMELLFKANPELEKTMLDFRQTGDGKKLKEIIALINKLVPGLYGKMRKLQYKVADINSWASLYSQAKDSLEKK